ncbi:L,D-transpeptidase [Phenylobacterium sp.]|uniref:L,D-transpeptidase n=1 Tax=Phenylobacterium sp. TaxID=1871053 RepID=UPI002E3729CF|nr:L,D-transpeptidase [Phenylobacterium sp.]HEX4711220.1 L,D-transpeptidase [Phenylobacterium sp.]
MQLADWAIASSDNHGLPFVIIDKVAAEVFVFGADGQLRGAAPALLGLARGDRSTPFVGDRELSRIPPAERTTPAGRFDAFVGPAWGGKKVLWVNYATAISLHPVVVGKPKDHRLQRLKSPTPADNRITFGCIDVPTAFYGHVVRPAFARTKGVVYILPETTPLKEVFPFFQAQLGAASTLPDHVGSGPASHGGLAPQ